MLYIRTDMNRVIATGHLMRCLSIAEAAAEAGEEVTFIFADGQAEKLVHDRGFSAVVLHTAWDHMETEVNVLREMITGKRTEHKPPKICTAGGTDMMLIDSYMVTPQYLRMVSGFVKTAYIDDLGAADYPVHVLICYANYWKKYYDPQRCQHTYRHTKLLAGTKYVPLKKSFRNKKKKEIRQRVENLLLLSGGTDRYGILERLLERLCQERYRNIDVICGLYYEEYDRVSLRFGQYSNIRFYQAVQNMEDFMMRADVAVSAGGTALYELCACGTPAVSYSFADNQLDNVLQFQNDGLIDYAGDVRDGDIFERAAALVKEYDNSYALRKERSEKMQRLVDGNGAVRIVRELIEIKQQYLFELKEERKSE